jgi:hypothetical protein
LQDFHPILPENYYDKALTKIPEDYKIVVFKEKQDTEDVEKIINNLKVKHKHKFVFIDDDIPDWTQLIIMSLCKVNIIANSTFSWWGAYFNEHAEKKVYYPSLWFGKNIQNDTSDLFLPEWEKIQI